MTPLAAAPSGDVGRGVTISGIRAPVQGGSSDYGLWMLWSVMDVMNR